MLSAKLMRKVFKDIVFKFLLIVRKLMIMEFAVSAKMVMNMFLVLVFKLKNAQQINTCTKMEFVLMLLLDVFLSIHQMDIV